MKFEFDANKSTTNAEKHGISFVEAQAIWADGRSIDLDSMVSGEQRRLAVGMVGRHLWTAVWTMRGDAVRIISVRRARKDELEKWLEGQ